MDPYVDVQFPGLVHLPDTILATGGNHKSRGPQPKVFKERGTKLSVSGWRSKAIRHPSFILYRFLTSSTGITSEEYVPVGSLYRLLDSHVSLRLGLSSSQFTNSVICLYSSFIVDGENYT